MRQYAILLTLGLSGIRQSCRHLSSTIGISRSAVSRGSDILELRGYIKRVRNEQDLRDTFLLITEAGHDYLNKLGDEIVQWAAITEQHPPPIRRVT